MLWPRWPILYEEANQKDLAAQKLSSMQEFLAAAFGPAALCVQLAEPCVS